MTAVETAARELFQQLLDAWNNRDAERYAALFAADAVLVGFDGSQVDGGDVADHLRPIFEDHPTAAYVAKVRAIRPIGPDAVLLHAIAGMVPPGKAELNPATNAVQCLVAERRDDRWRIVLFQNTPAQYHGRPEATERHTSALAPQVASGTTVA